MGNIRPFSRGIANERMGRTPRGYLRLRRAMNAFLSARVAQQRQLHERQQELRSLKLLKWILVGLTILFVSLVLAQAAYGELGPVEAWVCCDGSGGFRVCYVDEYKPENMTDVCLLRHELDHIKYFEQNRPDICKNKREGFPDISNPEEGFSLYSIEAQYLECRAYDVQRKCLSLKGLQDSAYALWEGAKQLYGCEDSVNYQKARLETYIGMRVVAGDKVIHEEEAIVWERE